MVVGLANGNFLIAYTDNSNSVDSSNGSDIIGQIYGATGNPLGPAFQLNSLATADDESNPEIAARSDGGFVVVYEDKDANGTSLIYEAYDAEGTRLRSDVLVEDDNDDVVSLPRISIFSDDGFVVSYTREIDGESFVRTKQVTLCGAILPETLMGSDLDNPRSADVAVLSNDSYAVAIVGNDGDKAYIEIIARAQDGSFAFFADVDSPGFKVEDPHVVTLPGDRFLVVWADEVSGDRQIYGQVFGNDGDPRTPLLEIATDADSDHQPTVAALDDGGFVVLYREGAADEKIVGQRFDAGGERVGEEFTLAEVSGSTSVSHPEVALLSDGRIAATWVKTDGDADVVAQIWDPRGESIFGSHDDDVLTGLQEASTVDGGGGEDSIFGVSGNDRLYGNSGSDRLYGDRGSDRLYGMGDQDFIVGGSGRDRLFGGSGADTLVMQADFVRPNETYDGGSGIDRLVLRSGMELPSDVEIRSIEALVVRATSANDSLGGSDFTYDILFGASGSDDLRGGTGVDSLYGGFHEDILRGNADDDSLFGGKAVDSLFGNDGNDTAYGGADTDRMSGSSGDDMLFGDAGRDFLNGNTGADTLYGGTGNDTMVIDTVTDLVVEVAGEGTADLVRSELRDYTLAADADIERANVAKGVLDGQLTGNALHNVLTGNTGHNQLSGGQGDDLLRGQNGNDLLFGDNGNDTVKGGGGDDTLDGGADVVVFGPGPDTLIGQKGNDLLDLAIGEQAFGGAGDDSFFFDGDEFGGQSGLYSPVIHDFHGQVLNAGGQQDLLVFAEGMETGSFVYREGDAFTGSGNSEARHAGGGQIEVDHDGDGSADIGFRIVDMSEDGQLTAQDFLWL